MSQTLWLGCDGDFEHPFRHLEVGFPRWIQHKELSQPTSLTRANFVEGWKQYTSALFNPSSIDNACIALDKRHGDTLPSAPHRTTTAGIKARADERAARRQTTLPPPRHSTPSHPRHRAPDHRDELVPASPAGHGAQPAASRLGVQDLVLAHTGHSGRRELGQQCKCCVSIPLTPPRCAYTTSTARASPSPSPCTATKRRFSTWHGPRCVTAEEMPRSMTNRRLRTARISSRRAAITPSSCTT